MMRFLFAASLLATTGLAQVTINEFNYDDSGTDNFSFVELYNAGAAVDISGWTVISIDNLGSSVPYTIPAATILLANSYYVIGNVAVPNVNQVVPDGSPGMLLDANAAIELRNASNVLVDSVCYEMSAGAFGIYPAEGNGIYGDLATGNGTSSIGRILDGLDTNRNSIDFAASMKFTPGATNNLPSLLPYFEDGSTGSYLAAVPNWTNGFVFGKYVDPTVPDAENHSVKPASPNGGLAVSMWDRTGGGNTIELQTAPVTDIVYESYVWLEPTMTPVNPATTPYTVITGQYNLGDGEFWAIGVRGSAGANSNPPNVPGTYYNDIILGVGFRPHFMSGLAWVHYRTVNYSRLYLVDLKDGQQINPSSPNFTILGGPIDILPGVNDGWQRIRLHVQGNDVVGNFGGTYGLDNGTRFSGKTTTTGPGMVYIGFREAVLGDLNCQPPLFDAIDIHLPTTAKSQYGFGSPMSSSLVPTIDTDGLPILGSTGFGFRSTNHLPSFPVAYLAISFNPFAPGFQIPPAPPGAYAFMLSQDLEFFMGTDPSGTAFQLTPVPSSTSYLGFTVAAQFAAVDPAYAGSYSLPIATSPALLLTIGR